MPSLYRIDADGRMWACADDGGDDERGGVHLANNFSGAREDDLDVAAEEENRTGAPTNPSPASSPNPVASLGQQQQAVGSTAHTSSQRAAAGIGGGLCGSFAPKKVSVLNLFFLSRSRLSRLPVRNSGIVRSAANVHVLLC